MSRMNAGLILAGQQPDFVNTLARSTQAASLANQNDRQRQMNALYQQHGQGILAGEQGSLNALAQMDPEAALQVRQFNQTHEMKQRQMDLDERQFDLNLAEFASKASEAEKAKVAENLSNIMIGAIPFYQSGDLEGLNRHLESLGDEPLNSIDEFPAYAARNERAFKALKQVEEFTQDEGPLSPQGKLKADLEAGRITPEQFNAASQKTGIRVTQTKDGFTFEQGVGVGGDDPSDVTSPSSPAAMIESIDGILDDPALDFATGWLQWTQNIPGTGAKRFGARADQLQGQAFLQAFESLKGGGQITEIEGQQATRAIGRLDTAQSAKDYRDALNELKGILQKGMARKLGIDVPEENQQPARRRYNLETGAFE